MYALGFAALRLGSLPPCDAALFLSSALRIKFASSPPSVAGPSGKAAPALRGGAGVMKATVLLRVGSEPEDVALFVKVLETAVGSCGKALRGTAMSRLGE